MSDLILRQNGENIGTMKRSNATRRYDAVLAYEIRT
ncbi:MAG: hypothetical protein Ct9H90mP13_12380 [Pseudomonadota bacterium]|nr:MAG: hypothetical protein Ct9H90mP13_12380 [Pseudomonadota bacterium]